MFHASLPTFPFTTLYWSFVSLDIHPSSTILLINCITPAMSLSMQLTQETMRPLQEIQKCVKPVLTLLVILLFHYSSVAQLKADFTIDKNAGCSPLTVSFTNKTTGASANALYKWDFGNGNSAAITNPGAIYKDPKIYTVTLTVQDGSQSSVKTQQVTVHNNPTVDFTTSTPKFCMPTPASFTSTSTAGSGIITNWYWDFGDGFTQTTAVPSATHSYPVAQKSTVSLTVKNNYGCYSTLQKQDLVESLPHLIVAFSADKRVLCKETESIQFTSNSAGPGTLTYLWDLGDGNTSTAKDPAHTYNKAGIYTVKLTVTSSEGCTNSNTQTGYINVNSFSTNFSVPSPICVNNSADFSSISSPTPNSSAWEINGLPYTYGHYMNYYFNVPGTYTIRLINSYALCKDTATKTITVHSLPNAQGFESTVNGICGAPVSVTVKDTTTGAVQWQWDFSNYATGNPYAYTQTASTTYTANSQYLVWLKVTNAAGCSKMVVKPVNIVGPTVHIQLVSTSQPGNSTYSCKPITATFKAYTTEDIAEYKWDFGDGGTAVAAEPAYTWSTPGSFQVKLTYKTRNGCTGIAYYNSIELNPTPKADFKVLGSTDICGNNPVNFNNTSTGVANSMSWYVDGSYASSNFSVFTYEFMTAGKHTIRLIAGNRGCYDTITRVDYVNVVPPFVRLTGITNTCDGTRGTVTFSQTSTGATQWVWDFGDGNKQTLTADVPSVTHTYTKSGNYKVELTGTAGSCNIVKIGPVQVLLKQSPVVTTTATEFCRDSPIPYTLGNIEDNPFPKSSFDNDYYPTKWEYGDGSIFAGTSPIWGIDHPGYGSTLRYVSPQQNKLRLITRSHGFGCADTSNYFTYQLSGPVAGFDVPGVINCYTQPVTFTDTSKSLNNAIKTWQWQFGDGNTVTNTQGTSPVHTYANPNYYNVLLRVTDIKGCTSEVSKYINVVGPKAAFAASATNVALNSTVNFYNTTNNSGAINTTYLWDFDDGTATSTAMSPMHTFTQPGTYTVKLTATNAATGCTSEATTTITVRVFNSAFSFTKSFITGKHCAPMMVQFTNTSVNFTRVTWDFGDGITAGNLMSPSHIYEKPGKYIIRLNVYGPNGLTGSYTDSVLIQQPQGSLQANITEGCTGQQVTLNAAGEKVNSYAWDFGDGTIVQTSDSVATHPYLHAGTYIPNILLTDANGCTVFAGPPDTITIRPNPVVNINPPQPVLCLGSSMPLQASGGSNYSWSPATGLNNPSIASPVASPTVNTTYTVQVADDIGCKNTGSVTVQVVNPVTVHIAPTVSVCAGDTLPLQATGAVLYNWVFTTTGLSHTQISNPLASPAVTTTYTVTGSDAYRCFTDTAEVTVQVLPLPVVDAGKDIEVWTGSSIQLQSTGSTDIVQWNWTPTQWLDCPTCPSTSGIPLAETNYLLTVKSSNGCSASDNVLVKMLCAESRVAIPNAFAPNGNGKNDVFIIKGISIVKHLMIFNRWGQKVFDRKNFIASDRSMCWDGTFNGYPAAEGTYVYFAEMQCPSGGTFSRKGTVVLIR
jgi:gliding motility-associated-like protein